MSNSLSFYQERLELHKAVFSLIEHDDATVAVVYKVTQPNGLEFILKICDRPPDYLREVYFLNFFAGKLPVPRLIQLVKPERGVHGAILMEFLPGRLLTEADLNDSVAYEMGSLLARIHENRTAGYGDLIQPDSLSLDPRVHFTLKFEEGLEECRLHLPESLLAQCRRYFDEHLDQLGTVDGPCLIHRDFRPGNIIANEGKIQGIIDWSSARAGFAEEDFYLMGEGEWRADEAGKKSFLSGYASIRPVPAFSLIMPFLRLSRAIGAIGFTVKKGTWKSSHARLYQSNRSFLEACMKSLI